MTKTTPTPQLAATELGTIHRSTHSPLRTALDSLPEWTSVLDRLMALEAMTPPHVNRASFDIEISAYITGLLDKGEPLDVDKAADHFAQIKGRIDALNAVDVSIQITRRDLTEQLDQAVRANTATLYRSLNAQMTTAIEQARPIADVASMDTASVLASGRGDDWTQYREAQTTYTACRSSAGTLHNRLGFNDQILYPELIQISNPADKKLFEHWRAWKVDGALVNPQNLADRVPIDPPWPTDAYNHMSRDAGVMFAWLTATPAAHAWIPTPDEFETAHDELRSYVFDMPHDRPRRHEQTPPQQSEYAERTKTLPRRKSRVRA